MSVNASNPVQALALYAQALAAGRLIQGHWQARDGAGAPLSCLLGVLGPQVERPAACPPGVMPLWLAQLSSLLFDALPAEEAGAWGLQLYGQLKCLDAQLPFAVIDHWQAHTVAPLLLEASARRGGDPQRHRRVQALHRRALLGLRPGRAEWRAALGAALPEVYDLAFARSQAYARAHASALAYANAAANGAMIAEHFGTAQAYADYYAELASTASAASSTSANARANAELAAEAYARGDAQCYAETYAHAGARAVALAFAQGGEGQDKRLHRAYQRLASGLLDSLGRVDGGVFNSAHQGESAR
ncbi:MAG: hypothetical protein ABWY06_06490 [Pseudomonas sp.]|uniref:hypothetical protein n=1 Tax=Pseudomonas sp. TaxID=306 RepID=UPI003395BE57